MKLRKAEEKDIERVVKFMFEVDGRAQEEADERVRKFILDNRGIRLVIIAEEKGEILGYIGLKKSEDEDESLKYVKNKDEAHVVWIAVHPEHRGKGIGKKLLKEAEKYARKWGKNGIWLDCRLDRQKFYENSKYSLVGTYKHKGKERIVMEKKI